MVQLLTTKQVLKRVGVTYPCLWTWMRDGLFPRSVVLQPDQYNSKVGWHKKEIDAWIKSRPKSVLVDDPKNPRRMKANRAVSQRVEK